MIKVLFVCLGNICRSPMAEALFRHIVKEAGLEERIQVDSVGTGNWHVGKKPHEGTRRLLDSKQISYEGIVARQLTAEDVEQFDYILAMDSDNLAEIKKINSPAKTYIARFLDLDPETKITDVPDPYYTGNFEEVYQLLEKGCRILLEKIRERHLS